MAGIPLIVKYFNGDSSPEEALYIEQWAASSPENQVLLEETWREWVRVSGESAPGMPDVFEEWKILQQQFTGKPAGKVAGAGWLKGHLYLVVSALLLLGVVVWFFFPRKGPEPQAPSQPQATRGTSITDSSRGPGGGQGDSLRIFDFRNVSLEEASRELSKAYGVRILPRNPGVLNCRFTTRFDHESLSYILDVITETLNITYAYSPDRKTVYLSGKGCEKRE